MIPGSSGSVSVQGIDPRTADARTVVRRIGLVPQESADLLYGETVGEECSTSDRDAALEPGTTAGVLRMLNDSIPADRHPRDLSEGQRLTLALAIILGPAPRVIALDEPTRGLDYSAKRRLAQHLRELSERGHAVIVATHDVEFAAVLFHRVIVLADGDVVADGPTREVVIASPAFAPQVSKILAPVPLLSVDEVVTATQGHP
jgi:energy-coupling factor transport system ATP-binding protein